MELRSLASPKAWKHRMIEAAWRLWPGPPIPRQPLTWPVDASALADIEVVWPKEYPWKPRRIMGDQIYHALRRYVSVTRDNLTQPYDRAVNAIVRVGGREHSVIWETSDYAELNETAYRDADLHFKFEFQLGGYGDRPKLLPGGYVSADRSLYTYLPRLREQRDHHAPLYEVYGRYGLSMEKRRKPLEILHSAKRFRFYGGEGKVRYSAYLAEVARSKICIDLPSMSSITFRCIDLLAVGSCIVGPPHTNQLIRPFENGVHVTYCRPDYTDLEDICADLLSDDRRRRELVLNSRAFFDKYVHLDQQAAYWLYHIVERLA